MVDINKFLPFFHDGSIIDIQHHGDEMIISMESAEIEKKEVKDPVRFISEKGRIRGKLHIEKIKSIRINGKIFLTPIKMNYDCGGIFDLKISQDSVELSVDWVNFPPKNEINDFSIIIIEAKKKLVGKHEVFIKKMIR